MAAAKTGNEISVSAGAENAEAEMMTPIEAGAEHAEPEKLKPIEGGRMYSAGDVHILVIDDDPSIGRLVKATLAGHEFHIDVVSDPQKVPEVLRQGQFHLVILDYVLPGLESTEVLTLLQESQPDAGIIVVTAFPSINSALQCLRAHTFDYITKPFQVDVLKKTVMRCLEARGLLRLSEEALREQLGAAIRERRKALGLTLADMSQRSSVSLGYLSQIELGKNSASIETLYRIALGLRIRVADLFNAVQS
jgi:DNA-binding response OmpR family regulator